MARKKAKEEVTKTSKPEVEVSNREENERAMQSLLSPQSESECVSEEPSQSKVTEISDQEQPERKKGEQGRLHVLADDRLNSLINTANELGITDIVQILNSDRFGQFYMVYRA